MRRHHLVRATGRIASLEIFLTKELDRHSLDEMSSIYGARVGCARSTVVPRSRIGRDLRALGHPGSPMRAAQKDWRTLRRDVRSWASTYDLTVVENLEDFVILAPVLQAPVVVDADDRESEIMRHVRTLLRTSDERRRHRPGLMGGVVFFCRRAARDLYLMLEQYRWVGAERFLKRRADCILVASDEDLVASGHSAKAVVVPNGFELRGSPAGSKDVHTPPTVAFWGFMSYAPNRYGAQWLLTEVLPLLMSRVPDVRLLVIGSGSELLTLPERGHVLATGFVEDLSTQLSETDVAAVPLRAGGGTRIKIIEAWANNIPVVSTSLGAYGLGAIDGANLLLADDPAGFARAIALVLEDSAVRHRLIEGGAARARALRWSNIEKDLGEHLASLAVADGSVSLGGQNR